MVERYEEVIEDWYKGNQEEDLTTYLCEKHVLKGGDTGKTGEKPPLRFYTTDHSKLVVVWSLTRFQLKIQPVV